MVQVLGSETLHCAQAPMAKHPSVAQAGRQQTREKWDLLFANEKQLSGTESALCTLFLTFPLVHFPM